MIIHFVAIHVMNDFSLGERATDFPFGYYLMQKSI